MNPILALTIIMLIWTISDFVSKKTKSLLSSLLVASVIFLIGFKTNIFPEDMLESSSLLTLGTTVVGFVIVHIGTMISFAEMKSQWKTFVIGFTAILGIVAALFAFGFLFDGKEYVISAIGAVSGGTISVVMVQEAAIAAGVMGAAILPVLIASIQGLIGFPISSFLLRKEAIRLKSELKTKELVSDSEKKKEEVKEENKNRLPSMFQTTPGTLCVVGLVVLLSTFLSDLTGGIVNTFIIALILGNLLRSLGIFKANILAGIDAFGLMMLSIMIIIFGPLATMSISDLINLIVPLFISFVVGISGCIIFAIIAGKIVGYSIPMSITIGLSSLYGFPGTMILSQEVSKSIGETPEEIQAIENKILPKMIVAGFSTVTITSVFITSILVGLI